MDISHAAEPRSDQINADDLMSGPRVVTITETRRGSSEQPVEIVTEEFGPGRPYRPGKSMIRVLINAWGADSKAYAGRRLKIYRDPKIRFGPDEVGGIRISHLSHIDKRITLALTMTRGSRKPFVVEPLPAGPPVITDAQADEIAAEIEQAADRAALDQIAAQLRTFDLAGHRARLGQLWKDRADALDNEGRTPPEATPILAAQWSHASQMLDELGHVDHDSKIAYLRRFLQTDDISDPLTLTEAEGNELTDELTRQIAANENGDTQQ